MRPLSLKELNCTYCRPHRGCNASLVNKGRKKHVTHKDKVHNKKTV